MDAGKGRGNYSSAYKLSRSTLNRKAVRRDRRSLEQKQLRHEEINKRRNLCDLSPLQESDAPLVQDKSYKDKTPVKPRKVDDSKGLQRLEQLKKWKQERERKRKEEEAEARKRNPVFRVSKTVQHGDTQLFGKTDSKKQTLKTKPKPAPVGKPSTQKVMPSHGKSVTQIKPSHPVAASKPHVDSRSRQTTKVQAVGKQQPATATRSTSRRAQTEQVVEKPHKKEKAPAQKPSVQSTRSLRSARQAVRTEETTLRSTKPTTKEEAADSKLKAAAEPVSVSQPHEDSSSSPEINTTRVTRRGEITELSSDSFGQTTDFGFSAASFVFRPLSPASAAGFLCQNQDTSCTSFLETNPKRSSTPKKEKGQKKKSDAGESSRNRTLVSQTDDNVEQDVTQVNSTAVEQINKTVDSSPDVKNKSNRRSKRSVKRAESESALEDEVTVPTANAEKPTPRRNPRRSVSLSAAKEKIILQSTEKVDPQSEEKVDQQSTEKVKPRRSLRQAMMSSSQDMEDSAISKKEDQKQRHSTRSTAGSSDLDTSLEPKKGSPVKRRRSLRRSLLSVESDSEDVAERSTPRGRRKSRRSVAVVCESETIQEVSEDTDSVLENEVFEDKENVNLTSEDKENAGPSDDKNTSQKRVLSDSGVDMVGHNEQTTPATRKKRARNKSFGGFRLPDADSLVLSAKRRPRRKTLMPKSPEEWIEVLSNSPMVEMTRRKHKLGDTSLPVLNFDDIDSEEPESSVVSGEESVVKPEDSEAVFPVDVERNEVSSVSMEMENDANKENMPQVEETTSGTEVVQVGEVSSTQDGPSSDESSSDLEQDVPYFRQLLCTEINRLNGLSDHWNLINDNTELTEEVRGQIRTTVGQAKLLMDQRFKQFSGLIDNCEFKLGEKETTCMDLKGFWEMIYYQVEDVDNKFAELKKLKDNNWMDDKPNPVVKKVKKKISKPVVNKPAVKSKFAAFRAQMKKQKESISSPAAKSKEEEKVFEVPGFFTVSSPVRSPKPHCEGGTPKKATPASTKTEEKQDPSSTLSVPSSGEIMLNRTPARKSYLPAVPSPLLQDTTPLPRPVRTCTQKSSVPKRLIDEVDNSETDVLESESKRSKITPARRSLRPRKSVGFSDTVSVGVVSSPSVEGTDEDFARLLQPMAQEEPAEDGALNDSLSKYLQQFTTSDTLAKDDSPKCGRRRSSLKGCRSTERRRSRQRSVHFASPSAQNNAHNRLPHTPYNNGSLVKQKRVTRMSSQMESDIFSIDNIDNDENIPPPSFRSPRPSLLGTPPDMRKVPAKVNSYVPTGTLISFTP